MARLGVNVDHVATIRQARGERYPDPARAAQIALDSGAEQITIHLREDRRHIQDYDIFTVKQVTSQAGKLLNLEMGANPDIIAKAIECVPDWVCLVPEKREEITTEGGLALTDDNIFERVRYACEELRQKLPVIKISLFLEADLATLEKALELHIDAVELHTGRYAKLFLDKMDYGQELERFLQAAAFLKQHDIACHAGHGLTLESTKSLVELGVFTEYNIGHWIIAEAIFTGLKPVVESFVQLLKDN